MLFRWMIVASATAALFSLGGCAWFGSGPANIAGASDEECLVLTAALDKLSHDWRTNPGRDDLAVDTFAISADRIDSDYDSKLSGLLPPKGVPAVDVGNCGTPLASVSDRVDFVSPNHGIPAGDRRSCWRSDGGWISRAAIDADRTRAAMFYTDDVCGEKFWIVRLTKDTRGTWYADAPEPVERSAILPSQSG
jgi:hypothetical protein